MQNNEKELKVNLWEVVVNLKLSFLRYSSQKRMYIINCFNEFNFPKCC